MSMSDGEIKRLRDGISIKVPWTINTREPEVAKRYALQFIGTDYPDVSVVAATAPQLTVDGDVPLALIWTMEFRGPILSIRGLLEMWDHVVLSLD